MEVCNDRDIGIPACKLNCIPLIDVKHHANECVDVLVVVDKVDDIVNVTIKSTQKIVPRRNVTLIDDSCAQVQFTLWNDHVDKITPESLGNVFGIKGASVREYNGNLFECLYNFKYYRLGGFSLSGNSSTTILAAPDGDRTNHLYQWYVEKRPNAQVGSLTSDNSGAYEQECRAIGAINEIDLETLDRGMYVTVQGFINSIKSENIAYMVGLREEKRPRIVIFKVFRPARTVIARRRLRRKEINGVVPHVESKMSFVICIWSAWKSRISLELFGVRCLTKLHTRCLVSLLMS